MSRPSPETVIITGASAGVGRATARAFARRGAQIGLLARGIKGLASALKEVEDLGGKGLIFQADVARAGDVEHAADTVEAQLGPIDIWINNAMTSVFSPLKEMTTDEFHRVTEVTYLGTVYGTMAALKRMLPRNRGVIVQVGSALAYRSIPLQSAYCGAKHAIRGFTNSLRCELLHDGSAVHITMVQLPAVNTPQFTWVKSHLPRKAQPVPPIFQPEVPAEAIYWAAHHCRRELFVGMSTAKAIEGNKLIPGTLDHYLATKGYSGQQTDEPNPPDRPDNLWDPLDGECGADYGAHGEFGARCRRSSHQLWLTEHREWLGVAAAALAGAGLGFKAASKKLHRSADGLVRTLLGRGPRR
ncbi:MAG: short-chain dehydrogenase [Verrucomicrobia bacterium]|nr:MAG: short-chain dehydrogenase [Verrucomicrobiota bacterium]